MIKEIWRPIPNYEGYQISDCGRIKGKKILKTRTNKSGYIRVSLSENNVSKVYLVHRLVAQTFIENPENKPEVNHKNAIKSDNRVENLEWVTRSENMFHAYRNIPSLRRKTSPLMRIKIFRLDNENN